MDVLYSTNATATGGRVGHSRTEDGAVDVKLTSPKEMGGDGAAGVNPEQLFAAGYAGCFLGALKAAAKKSNVTVGDDATITATVGVGRRDDGGGLGLEVGLKAHVPGVDEATVKDLMEKAHVICPYSHAIKQTIDVKLSVG
jgi:lipoyl-dependent peroxiredoxin